MSEAAIEEVSVLSSIYCREGEFQLIQQSDQDGLVVQINSTVGEESAVDVSLLFHLHPRYPSCPPDISVSSTGLSRTQCHNIRQKLHDQAAALPPEPMVHQLMECFQEMTEGYRGGEQEEVKDKEQDTEWTAVLLLDHIRSQNHYIKLLERWTQQLQLTGTLLLGRSILIILQGTRPNIKGYCRLLKTVRVDVDSSGKKCKERMLKVLIETPSFSSCGNSLQGFVVKKYQSLPELAATCQELNMTEVYQHILPSLSD